MADVRPPRGTGPAGRELFKAVSTRFELEPHEMAVLGQAVRLVDRIVALDAIVDAEGVMSGERAHPALVEARLERLALARLMTALRLPDLFDEKPQHRGMRGVYKLDRARGTA